MSTTNTSNLAFAKPDVASEEDTWGDKLNDIFDALDAILGGRTSKSVAGSSNVTLSASEALPILQEYTGTLTGDIEVLFPSTSKRLHIVRNATDGDFTLTCNISGGSGVVIPQGETVAIQTDGTNVTRAVSIGGLLEGGLLTVESNDAGATEGPTLDLYRNSASPADSDVLGAVVFNGEDDGGNKTAYARIRAVANDVTDGTEDGALHVSTMVAGIEADRVVVGAGLYTPNATGGDKGADTINANEVYQGGALLVPVGSMLFYFGATPPAGWLALNGDSIGSAASSATQKSDAYEALFKHLWDSLSDTVAPVSGGRGASAAADWAANKTLTMPDSRGRSPIGAGQGASLTNRTTGATGGAETHTLNINQIPAHDHPMNLHAIPIGDGSPALAAYFNNTSTNSHTGSTGGGQPHNNMHPWLAAYWIIKF